MTTILDLVAVSVLNVSVHVLSEITECDSNQWLTCSEMLMFLILLQFSPMSLLSAGQSSKYALTGKLENIIKDKRFL